MYAHYAAFTKNTDMTTITKVQKAIEKLMHNGALTKIHKKYNLLDK